MNPNISSVLGGLSAMLGWGTNDFIASKLSRKHSYHDVFLWRGLFSTLLILILLILFYPNLSEVLNGVILIRLFISGLSLYVFIALLYKAFTIGNVSIISGVVALQTVVIIITGTLFLNQSVSKIEWVLIGFVFIGAILVSVNFKEVKQKNILSPGVKESLLAALIAGTTLWPNMEYVTERVNWIPANLFLNIFSVLSFLGFLLISHIIRKPIKLQTAKISTRDWLTFFLMGFFDIFGQIGLTLGLQYGVGIIVAPFLSATAVVTIPLALIFYKEKLRLEQFIGIFIVVLGAILLSIF